MKLMFEKSEKKSKIKRYTVYAVLTIVLSAFDIVLLDFLSIGGMTPDLLLILCAWITLSEGQFEGLFAAFIIGLFYDIVSLDVIGTSALAKTLVALIAGWFYGENKINRNIGSYRFLIIIFICSLFHNLLYFFLYIKFSEIVLMPFFFKYGIAKTFYTTVFAIFPMLARIPKNRLIS
ncbi:rod shape-determining protein MreD [Bacteroidota bacterium]